jgi:hypothetical protein
MSLAEDSFDSSAITRAAYDAAEQVLFVFFKSNSATPRVWAYTAVPQSCFDGLTQASSKGRYFLAHIRQQFQAKPLFPSSVELLLKRLAESGRTLQISWVEQLAATPAAQDTLGLFF